MDDAAAKRAKQEEHSRFTALQFRWLDQVRFDPELKPKPLAFLVAFSISKKMRLETMQAVVSHDELATQCSCTAGGVRKQLRALRDRHHLEVVERGNGSGRATVYSWILAGEVLTKGATEVSPSAGSAKSKKVPRSYHLPTPKGTTPVPERCNGRADKGATGVATYPYRTSSKPQEGAAAEVFKYPFSRPGEGVFVIVGTPPWTAWRKRIIATGGRPPYGIESKIDGRVETGRWFASEYPPQYENSTQLSRVVGIPAGDVL